MNPIFFVLLTVGAVNIVLGLVEPISVPNLLVGAALFVLAPLTLED